jgi:hypothetical protein
MWQQCYWGDDSVINVAKLLLNWQYYSCGEFFYRGNNSVIHVATLLLRQKLFDSCGETFSEVTTELLMWRHSYKSDDSINHVANFLLKWRQYYSCCDTASEVAIVLFIWRHCYWGEGILFFSWYQFNWGGDYVTVLIKGCYLRDDDVLWRWEQCVSKSKHALILKKFTLSLIFLHPVPFRCFSSWWKQNRFFETLLFYGKT